MALPVSYSTDISETITLTLFYEKSLMFGHYRTLSMTRIFQIALKVMRGNYPLPPVRRGHKFCQWELFFFPGSGTFTRTDFDHRTFSDTVAMTLAINEVLCRVIS